MASFDWQHAEPGIARIPSWAEGSDVWRSIAETPTLERLSDGYAQLRGLLDQRPLTSGSLRCPRVFVSHRNHRQDLAWAKRIAWLAVQSGFQYWLDADDVALQALPHAGNSPGAEALVTACLIEIALLNSSHVLAVMTCRTRGSMWVPYEYGRVKRVPTGRQAGCWLARACRVDPLTPEYLQLGVVTDDEVQITGWFGYERSAWTHATGLCGSGASDGWSSAGPPPPLER